MAGKVLPPPVLRQAFTFAHKDITHFFPGHMAKGLLQMQRRLKDVDCVVEVHDARIPFTGRNPRFMDTINIRPHILLLNKVDLADTRHRDKVEERLKEQGVNKVMYVNCKEQVNYTIKNKLVPAVIDLVSASSRYHRANAEEYNLLIIGVPNVGKSSLINALRRTHLKKGKATAVGGVAGITRSVLERIKVSEDPKMYLYDTPGIMIPNIPDMEVGMKLALCATLKDHLVGEDMIADYMLFWLNKHANYKYVKHFELPGPTDQIFQLLGHVAKQQNLILKHKSQSGGYVLRPNFPRAAQIVLRAFREGRLGKVNLDEALLNIPSTSSSAVKTKPQDSFGEFTNVVR